MSLARILAAVWQNVLRNRRAFLLSSIGLIVGVATLTFFIHLGLGVQSGVLNRIFPVNQIELEPKTVGIVGLRQEVVDQSRLGDKLVADFKALPDVMTVYPKQRSKFQARLWGGQALFGYAARTEAFFDGLSPELLHEELKRFEHVGASAAPSAPARKRKLAEPCKNDDECPLGRTCGGQAGARVCGDIVYWSRFADRGIALVCDPAAGDTQCARGFACVGGLCERRCDAAANGCQSGEVCAPARLASGYDPPPPPPSPGATAPPLGKVCRHACSADGDCDTSQTCVQGACERLACELGAPEDQLVDSPAKLAGTVRDRCSNGVSPTDPACQRAPCPTGTYCAPRSVVTAAGYCEAPVPIVLSPIIIELFNSSAAVSLGMQKIDGLEAMLGIQFMMHFGDSYFAADLPRELQAVKRAEVVGFSQKALEFGVTMPLTYVQGFNARWKGRGAAETYDTFILETRGNEDVSRLLGEVEGWGFELSRKSQDARKAGDLLFILTVVFSFISVVILFVAGVNIMHTFLTLVTERRYEIGIMRAIGATRRDIRRLFLTEALMLGLFGGVVGNVVSFGASRLVNWLGEKYLQGIPFKPDEFFAYDWRVVFGGIAFACVFCLLGALVPSNRAAKLDPAVVLTT